MRFQRDFCATAIEKNLHETKAMKIHQQTLVQEVANMANNIKILSEKLDQMLKNNRPSSIVKVDRSSQALISKALSVGTQTDNQKGDFLSLCKFSFRSFIVLYQ